MAIKGGLLLLKLGSDSFVEARTTGISINGEAVDVTNKDSSGFRTLLAGAGIVSASISLEGVYDEVSHIESVRGYSLDNSLNTFVLVDENLDEISASWLVTNFSTDGAYNGEQTFSFTLESSGTISVTDTP